VTNLGCILMEILAELLCSKGLAQTVQLSFKIKFARIPGCIPHLEKEKELGSCVSLAVALSRGFAFAQTHLNTSRTRPRRVLHTFQTRFACVPDACKGYLVAELYHM